MDQHWWEEESGETDLLTAVTLWNFGRKHCPKIVWANLYRVCWSREHLCRWVVPACASPHACPHAHVRWSREHLCSVCVAGVPKGYPCETTALRRRYESS